jgi:hypothetical protein
MEGMIDIGGSIFTIDLDAFSKVLATIDKGDGKSYETETNTSYDGDGQVISATVTSREFEKGKEIDAAKYDVLRMCLEIIFTYNEEVDDAMGLNNALNNTTIPFKLAFNTLLDYGILKEVEIE